MTDYLRSRRGRYLVQIRVPRKLRRPGRAKLVERYLGTSDLREAKAKAPGVVAEIMADFKAKRAGTDHAIVPSAMSHAFDAVRARTFDALAEGEIAGDALPAIDVAAVLKTYGIEPDEKVVRAFALVIAGGRTAAANRIETRAGPPPVPKPWRRPIATGETVESAAHLEEYLSTLAGHAKRKTVDMRRSTIKGFCAEFPSLSDVQRQSVQQWANRQLQAGDAVATVRRALSELRGYWRYLRSVQKVADDSEPFDKLTLPKPSKNGKAKAREAFSPADVLRLLSEAKARGDDALADLIDILRWTGARREEICALKIEKIGKGYIEITDAKTAAGWRQVPIHSQLAPTIKRLVKASKNGFLLSGLTANKYSRGDAIGKRFGKMKTALGFGKKQVLHSIRHTVAGLFKDAGVPEAIAAEIVGHGVFTMTYGLYGGSAVKLSTKRNAVEKLSYEKESMR